MWRRKRGKIAPGMLYQGQKRQDCRTYDKVYGCYFGWQTYYSIFSASTEHKWRIAFAVCPERFQQGV